MQLLVLVILCALACLTQASYLTFQVEPKSTACFYEDLNAGAPFEMNFEVIRGGLLDIKFQLSDPNRNVLQERMAFFNRPDDESNEAEGRVSIKATTAGAYKFCFDNTMSRWTAKVVAFEVRSKRANKQEAARLEHLGPMVDSVIKLSDDLDKVEKIQRNARNREKNHYSAVRDINTRLQWMVALSSVILFGLTAMSIMHIQKWFSEEEKRSGV